MCGIVGHIGNGNSVKRVLEGLRRLEYRGYDSSGICFKDNFGQLNLYKKTGKLENLFEVIKNVNCDSSISVGHTRWATHGIVEDRNSHPHLGGDVAIVHNGIIENVGKLKNLLIQNGYKFHSDTDSEVFLALILEELSTNNNFINAVINAFKKIEGNSAFVIQKKDSKNLLAIKRGNPLVCGINEMSHEVMVSSDPYALIGFVEKIYFPEDNVLCVLGGEENSLISFFELDGTRSEKFTTKIQELDVVESKKGEFEHYMLKEVYEQPVLIRNLSEFYFNDSTNEALTIFKKFSPKRIHIIGCGTAYFAGMIIKNYFERILRISTSISLASEFRYSYPIFEEGDLSIFISQSGETADTLAAQKLCKSANIPSISIVNVEGSSLFRACDANLLIKAGIEIGVASTKAFTQQVLSGRILVNCFNKTDETDELKRKFAILAHRIESLFSKISTINIIASRIQKYKGFLYTGRGKFYPVALEGALKLKEIAYVHAEGYASGELKHGPIALIDDDMVNVAIVGPELYEKSVSNIQEVKARRGRIVTIGPEGDKFLMELSDYYIPLNYVGLGEFSPLYANVANQLLAYFFAKHKGTDIDRPRNLAKSVTVE